LRGDPFQSPGAKQALAAVRALLDVDPARSKLNSCVAAFNSALDAANAA
jgi:hypothetical protein